MLFAPYCYIDLYNNSIEDFEGASKAIRNFNINDSVAHNSRLTI